MRPVLLKAIGTIRSPYKTLDEAPKQGKNREAVSVLELRDREMVSSIAGARRLRVLYWMHEAGRDVLWSSKRKRGIFATRSPERPNPIGLATVEVVDIKGKKVRVRHLDALDGTPLLRVIPLHS